MNLALPAYPPASLHSFTAPPPPVTPLPTTAPSTSSRRSRPKQRPAAPYANSAALAVARRVPFANPHAQVHERREQTPALWQGAWVGWLACQTALLVMVESTPIASHAGLAVALRALALGLFVLGFRVPCFPSAPGRVGFAWCVVAAEAAVAAACNRWSVVAGWPLVTALALPLLAGLRTVSSLFTFNGAALAMLEALHPLLANATRVVAAVGPALFRRNPNTFGARVWSLCLDGVEQTRRTCARTINRRRTSNPNRY